MLLGLASKGEDPQGDAWVTEFRDTKILNQLVPTRGVATAPISFG